MKHMEGQDENSNPLTGEEYDQVGDLDEEKKLLLENAKLRE